VTLLAGPVRAAWLFRPRKRERQEWPVAEGKGRAGKRAVAEAGAGAAGPNDREGRGEEKKFLFIYLNTIFKSKFNSNLNPFDVLIKPNHHKINMQQHVCTNMLLPYDKF